jgi:hypothetical protein
MRRAGDVKQRCPKPSLRGATGSSPVGRLRGETIQSGHSRLDCFRLARNDASQKTKPKKESLERKPKKKVRMERTNKCEGRRNAGRRIVQWSAHRKQVYAVCADHLRVRLAPRIRRLAPPSPLWGALACRRSATALAAANERRRSAPAALPGAVQLRSGRYPLPARSLAGASARLSELLAGRS